VSTALLIALAVLLVALLLASFAWAVRASPRNPRLSGIEHRERAMAAQAEIEEHDIDQMIEARNEIRRRRGKPTIGEELADQARGEQEQD
jgi:hypothetical protein